MARNGWDIDETGNKIYHSVCGKPYKVALMDEGRYSAHEHLCAEVKVVSYDIPIVGKMRDTLVVSPTPKIGRKDIMAETQKAMAKAPKTLMVEVKDPQGAVVGTLLATERTFTTGSKGFGAYGKIGAKGSSQGYYQVGVNIVLVGSKPSK